MRAKSKLIGAIFGLLLTAACTTSDAAEVVTPVDPPTESTVVQGSTTSTSAAVAEKSDQRIALDRVVGWMNGTPLLEVDYEESFASSFRTQLGYADIRTIFESFSSVGPWRVGEIVSEAGLSLETTIVRDEGESLVASVGVDGTMPEQLALLFFQPESVANFEAPASFDEAADRLAASGEFSYLIADVSDGTCVSETDVGAETVRPLGSMFKLYVLGAVLDAIEAGTIGWADDVEIRDELDSLPSGTTQDDPAGSTETVLEIATRMIEISDNTATDHLMDLVGRDAVVQAMSDYGHSQPALNVPFLNTRELFVLKLVSSDEERAAYIAADATERQRILDEDLADVPVPPLSDVGAWTKPIAVNELEWFGTANDMCRAIVKLASDETAKKILTDPNYLASSPFVGFKGGSEPGVLAGTWYMEGNDGTSKVLVSMVVNEANELRAESQLLTFELRDFVAEEL